MFLVRFVLAKSESGQTPGLAAFRATETFLLAHTCLPTPAHRAWRILHHGHGMSFTPQRTHTSPVQCPDTSFALQPDVLLPGCGPRVPPANETDTTSCLRLSCGRLQSYLPEPLFARLGIWLCLERSFNKFWVVPVCKRGSQAMHMQRRVWAVANGFAQDLSVTSRLWENVNTSWQVANKIYMVQNMPELSK